MLVVAVQLGFNHIIQYELFAVEASAKPCAVSVTEDIRVGQFPIEKYAPVGCGRFPSHLVERLPFLLPKGCHIR